MQIRQEFSFGKLDIELGLRGRYEGLGDKGNDAVRAAVLADLATLPMRQEAYSTSLVSDDSRRSSEGFAADYSGDAITCTVESGFGTIQVQLTVNDVHGAIPELFIQVVANDIAGTIRKHADAAICGQTAMNDAFVQIVDRLTSRQPSQSPRQLASTGSHSGS